MPILLHTRLIWVSSHHHQERQEEPAWPSIHAPLCIYLIMNELTFSRLAIAACLLELFFLFFFVFPLNITRIASRPNNPGRARKKNVTFLAP